MMSAPPWHHMHSTLSIDTFINHHRHYHDGFIRQDPLIRELWSVTFLFSFSFFFFSFQFIYLFFCCCCLVCLVFFLGCFSLGAIEESLLIRVPRMPKPNAEEKRIKRRVDTIKRPVGRSRRLGQLLNDQTKNGRLAIPAIPQMDIHSLVVLSPLAEINGKSLSA